MKRREIRQALQDAGFSLVRNGKKHELWSNGTQSITISHGTKVSHSTLKFMKVKLRRASQLSNL